MALIEADVGLAVTVPVADDGPIAVLAIVERKVAGIPLMIAIGIETIL